MAIAIFDLPHGIDRIELDFYELQQVLILLWNSS
jgi:hypothetical protein